MWNLCWTLITMMWSGRDNAKHVNCVNTYNMKLIQHSIASGHTSLFSLALKWLLILFKTLTQTLHSSSMWAKYWVTFLRWKWYIFYCSHYRAMRKIVPKWIMLQRGSMLHIWNKIDVRSGNYSHHTEVRCSNFEMSSLLRYFTNTSIFKYLPWHSTCVFADWNH